ncbi:MAG: N-acetyltransferase [Pseudomonadota bacterium]
MLIRDETPADQRAIFDLTEIAFAPMAFSDGTEQFISDRLREDGDLTLSLIAEDGGTIVGHAAFSPVTIGSTQGGWYGLGPISVAPDRQRGGIGSALIEAGLARLRDMGAAGCALVGNPDYYHRFGFRSGSVSYRETPIQYVHALAFDGPAPQGEIAFAPAFNIEAP